MARRAREVLRRLREAFGGLSNELRVAAAAAVLLVASTFGPFSWI